MTEIRTEGLSIGYGGNPIVSGIDLSFGGPEFVCILGQNGAGKTTLAKALTKLVKPLSGRITVDGRDMSQISLPELSRIIAYVSSEFSTVFSMSVTEAVLTGRHPYSGWGTSEEDLRIADWAVSKLNLQDLADADVRDLSSGQLQRVTIAMGIAQKTPVLILDEPTSNLDVKYQMEVMGFLRRYAHEEGVTVIMVCHDINLTFSYADRVILVSGGRIYADGAPGDVLTEESIRDVYGVESKVAEIDGRMYILIVREDLR